MNGIKNYLLKSEYSTSSAGSSASNSFNDLRLLIENERANLSLTEILNVDSIIEDCLQSILLRPLKAKIYYLLVDWLIVDGTLISNSKNMKKLNEEIFDDRASNKCVEFFTHQDHMPSESSLVLIKSFYNCMQCEYAPLIKLKYILFIINELLSSIKDFEPALADLESLNLLDFLPSLIYAICKCKMYTIQIELDYIWHLVNKQLLNNETIYYLTLMNSACHIIKVLNNGYSGMNSRSYLSAGLIDVFLPDDKFQTVRTKLLPVRAGAKCREVTNMIAFTFKIFNTDSYALYYIENGFEKKLREDESPLEIKSDRMKLSGAGGAANTKFVYKQKNINLVWPKSI
jgi:hypothetical protein